METVIIRNETPADYRRVEEVTREAFWNKNIPGCGEHYLVHRMRQHPDFIPQLDLVLEREGEIIAAVQYTRATLVDENGCELPVLTFGPVSVLPPYQRQGYGKRLLEHSFVIARTLGFPAIVIFGDPDNYVSRGFRCCKTMGVCLFPGVWPTALLVKELTPGALAGRQWQYRESPVCQVCGDEQAVAAFDAAFPSKEKGWQPSQEAFYIQSHSQVVL